MTIHASIEFPESPEIRKHRVTVRGYLLLDMFYGCRRENSGLAPPMPSASTPRAVARDLPPFLKRYRHGRQLIIQIASIGVFPQFRTAPIHFCGRGDNRIEALSIA
jgi:hypothetical protein